VIILTRVCIGMLSIPSIYPHQLFVNLLTDDALVDLASSSAAAALAAPTLYADVYNDLTAHLKEAILVRAALKAYVPPVVS
jgi:hypothetical protein